MIEPSCSVLDGPAPRHTGGYVLYFDLDGVLHPSTVFFERRRGPYLTHVEGHELFENAELLEQTLRPYPSLRLVLSTSWCFGYNGSIRRIASRLPDGLKERVVGSTYHSRMLDKEAFARASRGMQIWTDVVRRRPIDWLAVDDDHVAWPTWCLDRLVKTDDVLGISAPEVLSELRAKLAAMFAGNT
ncbi:HAD domain-containing protein [Paraburkholderia phenazinium]|uniref:HAD domain-containing protein n=1 Tax=Paraburkholderia phenazinium TaxID=60549 RepID=UPI00158F338F|nr:HAD domain-containing protein [Paraburkholderia phenazinium]